MLMSCISPAWLIKLFELLHGLRRACTIHVTRAECSVMAPPPALSGCQARRCAAQDLRELDRWHGRRKVCLRMAFKRGLHPFYPPAVQLLRPRMRGPLAAALASHPALQLEHWDPWRPQRQLLELLRAFLQARVPLPPTPSAQLLPWQRTAWRMCGAPRSSGPARMQRS